MSRQQSRSPGDGAIDPSLAQKKRARHRLVGAVCLCLLAAVLVPLVLESEPRPSRDLPLELAAAPGSSQSQGQSPARGDAAGRNASGAIASRGDGAAAGSPAGDSAGGSLSSVTTVTSPAGSEPAQPPVALGPPTASKPEGRGEPSRADGRPDAARGQRPDAGTAAKADGGRDGVKSVPAPMAPRAGAQAPAAAAASSTTAGNSAAGSTPIGSGKEPARPAKGDDGPDVIARLIERADGKSPAATAAAQRKFLVQIGAYSNVQSARTMSDRAAQAGLRPYQETVKTAQGDWIRVRVGPFPTRQDAERAQQDLKRAGVTAAIIAL